MNTPRPASPVPPASLPLEWHQLTGQQCLQVQTRLAHLRSCPEAYLWALDPAADKWRAIPREVAP